jgi:membrane-bound serine protease (ClpP class)
MVGETGTVERAIGDGKSGKVFVHGELWDAMANGSIPAGSRVTITGIDGMKLMVKQNSREA